MVLRGVPAPVGRSKGDIKKNHNQPILAPKEHPKGTRPTSRSHRLSIPVIYQTVLKSIIASLVLHCPKEILIEISKFINTIYPKLKDSCENSYMVNDTLEKKELVWKNITKRIQDVLYPLIHAINTEQKPLLPLSSTPDEVPSTTVGKAESTDIHALPLQGAPALKEHLSEAKGLNHIIKIYAQRYSGDKKMPLAIYTGLHLER